MGLPPNPDELTPWHCQASAIELWGYRAGWARVAITTEGAPASSPCRTPTHLDGRRPATAASISDWDSIRTSAVEFTTSAGTHHCPAPDRTSYSARSTWSGKSTASTSPWPELSAG